MSGEAGGSASEDKPILQCPVKFLPNAEGVLSLGTLLFKFVENGTGKKFQKLLSSFDSQLIAKDPVAGNANWQYPLKVFFTAAPKKGAPPPAEVKLESKTFAFQTMPDRSMISSFLSELKHASLPAITDSTSLLPAPQVIPQPIVEVVPLDERRKRKHKDEQSQKLARAKASLLARHDEIKKLYDQLVPSVVSDSEFWESKTKARLVQNEANKPEEQRKAVSWSLQERKDQNGVVEDSETITITPEYCQQEFVRNPRCYEAYKANVPDKMTEDKFWTLYRREVKLQKEGKSEKSSLLLAKVVKETDKPPGTYHAQKATAAVHPSVDLSSLLADDLRYVSSFPLAKTDEILQSGADDKRKSKVIEKCNRQGDVFQQEQLGHHDSSASADAKEVLQELREELVLSDLQEEEQARFNNLNITQNVAPRRESKASEHCDFGGLEAALGAWKGEDVSSCLPLSEQTFRSVQQASVANRNAYRIQRGAAQGSVVQMVFNNKTYKINEGFAAKLKQLSQKSFELFRYFWSCVPTGHVPLSLPPQTEQKLSRVLKCLEGVHDELESLRREINSHPENAHLYELTRALDASLSLIFGAVKDRAEKTKHHHIHPHYPPHHPHPHTTHHALPAATQHPPTTLPQHSPS